MPHSEAESEAQNASMGDGRMHRASFIDTRVKHNDGPEGWNYTNGHMPRRKSGLGILVEEEEDIDTIMRQRMGGADSEIRQ